ncbi:transglycosylase family protein [Streptomyces sp. adm13(2018)]|uniref:transglycosylase family protein n=1 Tax=Streptomyces sp. adm13(2018) TaxID=2479007 RepID=UPI002905AC33|nr:transglycosylase family protein [Streptomyces sp. adm13(2018)]
MTGSAMALPLLATGSASAADAATWDRVAECESGGQWSANFGNGMYGGLQFTQDSWERNGGLSYAPSPDLASRAQQIAVAEKALAKGSDAWATCAPIAGLKNDGASPGVDPGPTSVPKAPTGPVPESNWTTGLPGTSGAAAEADKGAEGTGKSEAGQKAPATVSPDASATPVSPTTPTSPPVSTDPGDPTVPTAPGTPDASVTPGAPDSTVPGSTEPGVPTDDPSSATPGTGKHRGDAAPEETETTENADKSDSSTESGRHASPGNKLDENPLKKSPADASKETDATDSQGKSDSYLVQPGDSLSDIAQENELSGGWTALYDANRGTVGVDPDLILPGQALDLTDGSTAPAE